MAIFYKPGGGTDLPSGAEGDLLYFDGSSWASFPVGSSGEYLVVSGGVPYWTNTHSFQPLDLDLTALAGLSGTGVSVRTGAGTWTTRSVVSASAALSVTNGSGVGGNISLDLDADLTALGAVSATGLLARTGSGTAAAREIVVDGSALTIANPGGVSGNPSLTLSDRLFTLGTNATVGLWVSGAGADVARSLAVGTGLTVSNPTGAAGNPTVGLDTALTKANTAFGSALGSASANHVLTADGSGNASWAATPSPQYVTFTARSSSPASNSLWMDNGTTYASGTLVWPNDAQVLGALGVGDPGFEQASILVNGASYVVPLKVNGFGTSRSGAALHQHSNTVAPALVFARARGTTSSHSAVQDADTLGELFWTGWVDGTTGYAIGAGIHAVVDGTPSGSSLPTRLDFRTTPSGATTSVDRWCILPNGTLRAASDNAYQIGNVTYAAKDIWAYQYSGKVESSVQAPAGGWTTSLWAVWTDASGVPKHTYNGTDATLLRDSDVGVTVQAQNAVLEALSDLSTLSGAATRISSVVIRLGSLIPRAGGVSEWGIVTAIVAGTVAYNSTAIRALRPWAQSRYTFTDAGACYVAATQASSSEIFQCSRLDEYYVSGGFALSSTASPVRGGFGWVGARTTLYEARTSALLSARACLEGGTLYAVLGDGTTNSNTAFLTALSADTNYRIGIRMRSGTTSFYLMNAVGTVLETQTLSVDLLSLTTTFATVGEGFIATSAATQYMYPGAIFIDQDE